MLVLKNMAPVNALKEMPNLENGKEIVLGRIMIIWINKKTGETYPEYGGDFTYWKDYKVKPNKYYFCIKGKGIGWKYYPAKDWESKEIPDLQDPEGMRQHPDIYRAYVKEYGENVAAAQLYCADFCKPSWSAVLLDPNYPDDATQKWFYETFNPKNLGDDIYPEFWKRTIWDFMITYLGMIYGKYLFDMCKFEGHLKSEFDFKPDENESIATFMQRTFGKDVVTRFRTLLDNKSQKTEKTV
jgi:hypothetical protein